MIDWKSVLMQGFSSMLSDPHIARTIGSEHVAETPRRAVAALAEYFSGCSLDPAEPLRRSFDSHNYDQMIVVDGIQLISFCAHHLIPFIGLVHFAYIPDGSIVGLSKIPRFIDILARRPQVQEKLTQEIVDTFQSTLNPRGCAVLVEAIHQCVLVRGVRKAGAVTRTIALRGVFLENPSTKSEFLTVVARNSKGVLEAFG